MKRVINTVLSIIILSTFMSCKSSSSSSKKKNNPPAATAVPTQPPSDQTANPPATTNSLVGGRYVQATPCSEGLWAKFLQLFGSICVSEVTFSDASAVGLIINGVSLTSTYSLVTSSIQIELKNAVRNDGGTSFGLGTVNFTASADYRSLTDVKNRILNRQ
jgi:hypothetical protein